MTATAARPIALTRTGRRISTIGTRLLEELGVLLVLLVAWQFVASAANNVFFPPPLRIFENSRRLFFGGTVETLFLTPAITVDAWSTIWRMLAGFAIGSIVGLLVGTAIGRSRALRETTDPVVEFLRSIPATATLPLFMILLGGGDLMRVAFIAYGLSWFVLINTASGVASVHATPIEMGQTFRLSRAAVVRRIVLPAASPKIVAGLRIAMTAALLLAVVSEFILATNGIGYRLVDAQTRFALLDMWSWMVLLAIVGFVFNTLIEIIEHRLLAWDRQSQATG